jgi:hypothetical protein
MVDELNFSNLEKKIIEIFYNNVEQQLINLNLLNYKDCEELIVNNISFYKDTDNYIYNKIGTKENSYKLVGFLKNDIIYTI